MGKVYLYMRVSTDKQELDTQERDLGSRFPHGIVWKETASGVKSRPRLFELVELLEKGDTLAVSAFDRLGRRCTEILTLIERLQRKGVNLITLREGVDYSTITGKLVTQILVSVAEMERNLISERTKTALRAKKAAGVRLGRPSIHSEENVAKARELRAEGHPFRKIAKDTGISRSRLGEIFGSKKAS